MNVRLVQWFVKSDRRTKSGVRWDLEQDTPGFPFYLQGWKHWTLVLGGPDLYLLTYQMPDGYYVTIAQKEN